METKPATILSFEAATGEGVARLSEPGSLPDVRFSLAACRGFAPAAGACVQVGLLGPDQGSPFSADFAFRAGLVELASEWPELPIVHTAGITAPERSTNFFGKPVALVPFDPTGFDGVKNSYPEELVAKLTFGPAAPTREREIPPHLSLIGAALRPVARIALACKTTDRDSDMLGATFVAGDAADIGDVPWPMHKKKPMMPLLQIGLDEARRIGLDKQVNVFVNAKPRSTSNTEVHVMMCEPGERRVGPKSLGERAVLSVLEEVPVYPDVVGLQSAYKSVGKDLPIDLQRYRDVCAIVGPKRKLMSIQREIQDHFPTSEDVEADVVLGGFSSMITQGGLPYRRVATFAIARFDWLRGFPKSDKTLFVDVSADDPMRAFLR